MAATDASTDDELWGQQIQKQTYWDDRYATEQKPFEWYCDYASIQPLLSQVLGPPPSSSPSPPSPSSSSSSSSSPPQKKQTNTILEIGCGNSELTVGLAKDGYDVIGTDYAATQIQSLQNEYPTIKFEHVDCRALQSSFGVERFSCVLDKACLDSMLSGGEEGKTTAMMTVEQVDQVLQGNGHFVVISHADPETELGEVLLGEVVIGNVNTTDYRWDVDVHSIEGEEDEENDGEDGEGEGGGDGGGIHVYVFHKVVRARTRSCMKRKRESSSDDVENEFRIKRHWH